MPGVGQVGIEPTQPCDNRFTVCPASPTAALTQINYVKQLRDPAGVRTQDPNIKSVVLYQLSYEIFFAESERLELSRRFLLDLTV